MKATLSLSALLTVHASLLAWSAMQHSPTLNEPGLLAAGIAHWQLDRFDICLVNPPLVRMMAAIPVLVADVETDWSRFHAGPAARPEYAVGSDFITANGPRSIWLMTLARWACIPFSLVGGLVCFDWGRRLYGARAGLFATTMWCFCPMILGHAALMTADVPASATGLAACYVFWRWMRRPRWRLVLLAGIVLGLAQLTKTTLIVLYPVLLGIGMMQHIPIPWTRRILMLAAISAISLNVLNAAYGFQKACRPLGEYEFVSTILKADPFRPSGNRFADTLTGRLPIPLPADYILGIDEQWHDFESWQVSSYLRGTFRSRGWWYYYLYGLGVKLPIGISALLVLAVIMAIRRQPAAQDRASAEPALLLPPAAILVLVSSQTGFSEHVRYAIPALPFLFARASRLAESHRAGVRRGAWVLLAGAVVSSLSVFPHSLSYFNELAGGPDGGPRHLLGSNVEWGQDLLYLKRWSEHHREARPLFVLADSLYDPAELGIDCTDWQASQPMTVNTGWYAVGVNELQRRGLLSRVQGVGYPREDQLRDSLQHLSPADRAGLSIWIYHVSTPHDFDSPARN